MTRASRRVPDQVTGAAHAGETQEGGLHLARASKAMRRLLKRILQPTPLYPPLRRVVRALREAREIAEWVASGRPLPPPHVVKRHTVLTFARRFRLRVLVETGTYQGAMVEAMLDHFDRIYSVELSRELYESARERFRGAHHVELIHGDSGTELGWLVPRLHRPALFWLDGHYSGADTARGRKDTPVLEELEHILGAPEGHVILIDDARCFGTEPGYPSLGDLRALVRSRRPDATISVQDDIIRIVTAAAPRARCA